MEFTMTNYNPDTEPFDLKLSNLPAIGAEAERAALIDVADTIDFAKRILLQHRVKAFTAADVIRVTEIILERIDMERGKGAENDVF
jgi:hypothetical protein